MQVPTGNKLPERRPRADVSVSLLRVSPGTAGDRSGCSASRRSGVMSSATTAASVINPHIVRGMTLGGIAHGLGATLLEEFVYDDAGPPDHPKLHGLSAAPLRTKCRNVEIVHHCTPSPHTVFGQKGSGESGYLGSPAAISSCHQRLRFRVARHFVQQASYSYFRDWRRHRRRATRQTARASHMNQEQSQ